MDDTFMDTFYIVNDNVIYFMKNDFDFQNVLISV